jgi:hypothetical protein
MTKRVKSRSTVLAAVLAVGIASLPALGKPHNNDNAPSVKGNYSFRMTPAKSFSADAPGDTGGIANSPRQDVPRVGVFTADGSGNLSGHTMATADTIQGKTWLVIFDWTGKYAVNGDGTGFFSVDTITNMVCTDMTVAHTGPTPHPVTTSGTPLSGNTACPTGADSIEGHEDYAFVFATPGGKRFEFMQTDNDGGGAKIFMTGSATLEQDNSGNSQGKQGKD